MTQLVNNVQLIGRAGLAPEIKTFENNRKMARFTLATNEYYLNKEGERVENTQWHNIVAFGKKADFIEKLVTKGKEVAIQGKLTNRKWEDKEGNKRKTVEVIVNEIVAMA